MNTNKVISAFLQTMMDCVEEEISRRESVEKDSADSEQGDDGDSHEFKWKDKDGDEGRVFISDDHTITLEVCEDGRCSAHDLDVSTVNEIKRTLANCIDYLSKDGSDTFANRPNLTWKDLLGDTGQIHPSMFNAHAFLSLEGSSSDFDIGHELDLQTMTELCNALNRFVEILESDTFHDAPAPAPVDSEPEEYYTSLDLGYGSFVEIKTQEGNDNFNFKVAYKDDHLPISKIDDIIEALQEAKRVALSGGDEK